MTNNSTQRSGAQSHARRRRHNGTDFQHIATAARINALPVCQQLLPGGRHQGQEYIVKNPRRTDAKPGSFRINFRTGRWADFAIGVGGGDLISLVAYLYDLRQGEAAHRLARMLGMRGRD